ncbi:hypothetical protein HK102_006458 [Quaeritorhiza haematococci]|nr:hypothetical protein HK102_006458 [Quaeritorhiza haematococci]
MTETDTEHRTSATSQQPSTHLRFSATLFPIPPGLPASHLLTTLSSPDIAVAVPNGLIRHCTRFGLNTQKQETEAWTDLMRDAKVVVVDEADMVLENPEGKNVLQTMAKMGPQRARIHPIADEETPHALPATAKRPFLSKYKAKKQTTILTFERSSLQFLFVAATLPVARVADSRNCGGYLADMFPRAAKIATEGVHRTPRTLRERFIHVDVGIGGLDKETDQRNEVEEQDGHSVGFTQDATSSSLPPFPNAQAARDFASKYKRFLPILIETLTGERSNAKNSNPPGFSYLETWIVFCNSAARVRRVEAQLASDREAIDQTVDRLKGKTGGSFRWRVDTLHAELHRDERLKRIAPYLSRHSKQADSFPWLPDATIKTHVSSRASTPSGDDIVAEIRTRTQGEPERDLRILICTDVAARGIDFGNDVGRVIQFDFAANAASYVHRAGRTARCGRDGESKYRAVVNLIDSILLNMGAAALSVRFALLNFPFLFLSTSQQHEVISFVSPSDNPLAQFIELAAQGGTNKKLSSSALGYPPSTPSITGKIPSDHLAAGVAAESSQETLDMSEIGGGEKTDESVGVSKTALTGLFSRKRSFSKKLKKRRRRMEHVGRPDGGKEKN